MQGAVQGREEPIMTSVTMAVLAFVCALSGAAVGVAVRSRLPRHHLRRDSTDVVKLATGLVATLVALVLSLLISTADSARVTVQNEFKTGRAQLIQLDRTLRAYGPQAAEVRATLREAFAEIFTQRWPHEDFHARSTPLPGNDNRLVDVEHEILVLQPASDEQKWFQSQALDLTVALAQIYRLVVSQEISAEPPWAVLFVVTICAAAIFASFGLFAPPNTTVVVSFVVAALAVAAAMFLIVDLGDPFNGFLNMSSAPAHAALDALGK
jgi:Protein of unknown function (DUF4239)